MFEQKNLKTFKVELDLPSSSLAPWYIWNPTIEVFFADEIRLSLIEFVGLLFYFIYYLKYKNINTACLHNLQLTFNKNCHE